MLPLIVLHCVFAAIFTVQVILWRLGRVPLAAGTRAIDRHRCHLEAVLAAFLQTCQTINNERESEEQKIRCVCESVWLLFAILISKQQSVKAAR